MHEDTRDDMNI